jgi:ATP-dependent Clp endopeptidase proteolytic subunit ClpP
MPATWAFKMRSGAGERVELDLYDTIGADPLFGGGISSQSVVDKLTASPKAKEILVRINSAGGIVTEGLAIYNLLRQSEAQVTCRVDALAGSIASIIAMGGSVEMAEHSVLMIHNPWGLVEGGAKELRSSADRLDMFRDEMLAIYCRKTGLTHDVVARMCEDETWMNAQTALSLGFADRIIPDAKEKLAAHFDLSAFRNVPRAIDPSRNAYALHVTIPERVDPAVSASVKTALADLMDNAAIATTELPSRIDDRGGSVAPPPNSTDAEKTALETQETTMAMTEEETKKVADLEAENAALKASLSTEQGARASAEEALAAAKKPKATDDDEEEEDGEEMAAKAAIDKAKELTGCTDVKQLRGALIGLEFKLKQGGQSAETHQARVKRLVAEGKLAPYLKATALKEWSPADLDGFLAMTKGAKMGPVGEEHDPDESAEEVVNAKASVQQARAFDASRVALDAAELAIVKQMGANDPGLGERMLTEKRAKAEADHRAKHGQPRA